MLRQRSSSLLAHFALHIVTPLSLAMLGLLLTGYVVYQQTILALVLDRDSELATVAALDVGYEIREYVRALEALAGDRDLMNPSAEVRMAALRQAVEQQEQSYYDGLTVLDQHGAVLASVPEGAAPDVAVAELFRGATPSSLASSSFLLGDIQNHPQTGEGFMVFAVPIRGVEGAVGALLGSFSAHESELAELVGDLNPGLDGFAYLVDRRGRVIYHPDSSLIGSEFIDRPFVQRVGQGETGASVWDASSGERWIADYAPVGKTGWGIVVKEPWEAAVAPAQTYGGVLIGIGVAVIFAVIGLLWRAVNRVAEPIAVLSEQSARLAAGRDLAPTAASGITEIDRLGSAFDEMATQLHSYHARLRRYVEALTRAQEEERQRIAHELHDETIQSLFAIARRLEIHQAAAADAGYHAQLGSLRSQLTQALEGVRRISYHLRPLMLDDLGLLPALEALVQSARHGPDGVRQATLDVAGNSYALDRDQELTIYRITQEALTNVRKHAQADVVRVNFVFEPHRLQLIITDNGQGFVVPASLSDLVDKGSLGLIGIQERVWVAGGTLSLQSAPGRGTILTVTMPPANRR